MLKPLRLVPANTDFDFVGLRKIAFAFSALLILGSILSYAISGLNFGIDFRGGILLEVRSKAEPPICRPCAAPWAWFRRDFDPGVWRPARCPHSGAAPSR